MSTGPVVTPYIPRTKRMHFLISLDTVEATHLIGQALNFPHWFVGWWLVGAAVVAGLLSANYLLQPKNWYASNLLSWLREKTQTRHTVFLVAVLAGMFLVGGSVLTREPHSRDEGPKTSVLDKSQEGAASSLPTAEVKPAQAHAANPIPHGRSMERSVRVFVEA